MDKTTKRCHVCGRPTQTPYATTPATFHYDRAQGLSYAICSKECLARLPEKA